MESKKSKWHGACLDTGAQRAIIGLNQAKVYCRFVGCKFKPRKNNNVYRFGVDRQVAVGSILIRIPTPGNSIIVLSVDVEKADVPFLLGLDVMDRFGLYLNTVKNKLVCPRFGWKMDVTRKLGHVYLEWTGNGHILFTRAELTKLHRNFYHPGVKNLMNLIKQARPSEFNEETRKVLQEISDACDTCQRFGPKTLRFRATLPAEDELIFGQELSIDLT